MRLKEIRESNHLSQKEIAEILHISRASYSIWELGIDLIPLERLNDFCNQFSYSLDYVLELNDVCNYIDSKENLNIKLSSTRLKEVRKQNQYTQSRLAEKLGTDNGVISRYENGHNMILTSFLIEYANTFHISCDYLVGKIDEPIQIGNKKRI